MQISQTTPPPTNLNLNSTSANLNPNFDPSNPNPNLPPRRSRKQDNLKIARAVIYRYDSLLRRIQLDNELADWTNATLGGQDLGCTQTNFARILSPF